MGVYVLKGHMALRSPPWYGQQMTRYEMPRKQKSPIDLPFDLFKTPKKLTHPQLISGDLGKTIVQWLPLETWGVAYCPWIIYLGFRLPKE